MDSATILVLVLCVGVAALLIWFEVNSLRNQASKKAASADAEAVLQKSQAAVEPKGDKKKAA